LRFVVSHICRKGRGRYGAPGDVGAVLVAVSEVGDSLAERMYMATDDPLSNERNVSAVVRKVEEFLGSILEDSGTILYSSRETLTEGFYYFLGVNPGGSEEGTNSIRQSLDELRTSTVNEYLDGNWNSNPNDKRRRPLQERFKFLFDELGEDPYAVCASNLIFKRSKSEKDDGGWKMAEKCWPVHEVILQIVKPHVIITFGRVPFDFIKEKLHGDYHLPEKTKHGNWTWRYSILEAGQKLIGLPHLSRYALTKDPRVVKRIKELIE
jgi:hypothetical protein